MRASWLAVLTLIAVAKVVAQPVVTNPVTSAPLSIRITSLTTALPAVAIARDEDGIAIAWSDDNAERLARIHVARLDGGLHQIGKEVELPTAAFGGECVEAVAPSLARFSNGFVLAWLEKEHTEYPSLPPTSWNAEYCLLDAQLRPLTPPMTLATRVSSAAIARSAAECWIGVEKVLMQIHADGAAGPPINVGFTIDDFGVASDSILVAGHTTGDPFGACSCGANSFCTGLCVCPPECRIPDHIDVVTRLYLQTDVVHLGGIINVPGPVLGVKSAGGVFAWFDGSRASGGNVIAKKVTPTGLDASAIHLGHYGPRSGVSGAAADDGERQVVTWATMNLSGDSDILGAAIDSAGSVTPLEIAVSTRSEENPSVIVIEHGVFLIAYETISGAERRIEGRLVIFPARRRTVR